MESISEINGKIANNLTYYRKAAGFTQAELAEKINYSDKSVSKWESGNGVPDVYILLQLTELFGITLNDLVCGETPEKAPKKRAQGMHLLIMLLSSGIVWLVATCVFVGLLLLKPGGAWWISFVYAVMANAIVLLVLSGIWKYRFLNFVSVSALVWTSITCFYLTWRNIAVGIGSSYEGLWCIFLLGIPLQILEVLWAFFRFVFTKDGRSQRAIRKQERKTKEKTKPEIEGTEISGEKN